MSKLSENIARDWGEKRGRTASSVFGEGLNSIFGGNLGADESVDWVHLGMAAVPIAYLISPKNAGSIAVVAATAAAILWSLGQDN